MTMMPIFRMTSPSFDREQVDAIAKRLGLDAEVLESSGSSVVSSEERVLVASGPCGRQPGVVMYMDSRHSLGALYERPPSADEASKYATALLDELRLLPSPRRTDRHEFSYEPEARVTEAVVFDGKERRAVVARTDFRLRMQVNGVPVNGPRTRVRLAFGDEEQPIFLYRALWERLDIHDEVDVVPEEDLLTTLEASLSARSGRNGKMQVHSTRLAYMADDFRGAPDLLAPSYLVEIEGPGRPSGKSAAAETPRQLLRLPAWRSASTARR